MTVHAVHHPHLAQPTLPLRTSALAKWLTALQPVRRPTQALRPWQNSGASDDKSRLGRLVLRGGVLLLHGLALWGLVQMMPVHHAVNPVVPLFMQALSAPPAVQVTAPVQPAPRRAKQPEAQTISPDTSLASLPVSTPAPLQPADTAVPASAPPTAPVTTAPAKVDVVVSAAASALSPSPSPTLPGAVTARIIPSAALHYLMAPVVDYPRQSRRQRETGLVIVRAFIDSAGGAPRTVQISQSSGFARLDAAAMAAVQRARFTSSTNNGQPVEGWALIPIRFELET